MEILGMPTLPFLDVVDQLADAQRGSPPGITRDMFIRTATRMRLLAGGSPPRADVESLFRGWDGNGDGVLSSLEVAVAIVQLAPNAVQSAQTLFRFFDKPKNGLLTPPKLAALVAGLAAHNDGMSSTRARPTDRNISAARELLDLQGADTGFTERQFVRWWTARD
jgi:hypothetical protein